MRLKGVIFIMLFACVGTAQTGIKYKLLREATTPSTLVVVTDGLGFDTIIIPLVDQTLSESNDTIYLTNGGYVIDTDTSGSYHISIDNDLSPTNELFDTTFIYEYIDGNCLGIIYDKGNLDGIGSSCDTIFFSKRPDPTFPNPYNIGNLVASNDTIYIETYIELGDGMIDLGGSGTKDDPLRLISDVLLNDSPTIDFTQQQTAIWTAKVDSLGLVGLGFNAGYQILFKSNDTIFLQSGGYVIDSDTNVDSTDVAGFGYVAGAHTVDTNVDSTDVAGFGYVAGSHTVDTNVDSTDVAGFGYVAGSHTVDTNIDSTDVAGFGYVAGSHTVDTNVDSTDVAGFGFVAGSHTIDTNVDSTDVAGFGYVAGAHTIDTNVDSTDVAGFGYVAGSHTVDTNVDSTDVAGFGFVAGSHTVDTNVDSMDVAGFGYVAGSHTVDTNVDSMDVAGFGYVAGAHTVDTYFRDSIIIFQDSILIGYRGGIELTRDTVRISGVGSGTDSQILSIDSTGRVFYISISNGNTVTFTDEVGAAVYQTLIASGNQLYQTQSPITIEIVGQNGIDFTASGDSLIVDGSGLDNFDKWIAKVIPDNTTREVFSNSYLNFEGIDGIATSMVGSTIKISGAGITPTDELWNHIMLQNVASSGYWISGDGGNEGIYIDSNGKVGINTSTLAQSFNINGISTLDRGGNTYLNGGNLTGAGSTNIVIGTKSLFAGTGLTTGQRNTVMGASALTSCTTCSDNFALGEKAMQLTNRSNNIAIGRRSLQSVVGDYNVGIGSLAGYISSANNVWIGDQSGLVSTGSNNVAIGRQAGRLSGSGGVYIGYQVGYSESGSNKLYIDNSATTSPLILGDFSANTLDINGKLQIRDVTTASDLYALTYNETSDEVTKVLVSGLGDDLGDHIMTANLQTNGNWISGDGGNEGMKVSSLGKVGIGESTPDEQLHVNGTVAFENLGSDPAEKLLGKDDTGDDIAAIELSNDLLLAANVLGLDADIAYGTTASSISNSTTTYADVTYSSTFVAGITYSSNVFTIAETGKYRVAFDGDVEEKGYIKITTSSGSREYYYNGNDNASQQRIFSLSASDTVKLEFKSFTGGISFILFDLQLSIEKID